MMDILQAIAAENQPVQWTTPLGLPVLQPYFKAERHTVSATSCSSMQSGIPVS